MTDPETVQLHSLTFAVTDSPAPQGSKRYVGRGASGHGVMLEMSKKVAPWREAVKEAASKAMGEPWMLAGPIAVRVTFTLHKPTTAPKRRKIWPSKRPDMDKLLRSTFDAIGAAGVWKDDSQVVHTDMAKCYPNEWTRNHSGATAPGALITVTPLEPETRGAE